MSRAMTCLIEINRSTPSAARLYQAARRLRQCEAVCLVHVIASGRAAEVEAGQRVLREAVRSLRRLDGDAVVTARLEIGDTAERIAAVADEFDAGLIVMGAYGEGDYPYLTRIGRTAGATLARTLRPVLLVSSVGAKLHRPWRSRRSGPIPTAPPPGVALASLQTLPSPL
jgi:nucleotide-binding universal stress UspA family protein